LLVCFQSNNCVRVCNKSGYHNIYDRNDRRPLENSLEAFELAWSSGIHLCECDISITKDQKLILAHDENFLRLALDRSSVLAVESISQLSFRELISLPLKSGVRPPLLIDVLRSAYAISDHSKLVIEIKPGNGAAASALGRLLLRHPELRKTVAVVMSFDVVTMHRLRADLSVLNDVTDDMTSPFAGSQVGMNKRITSFDHFGVMGKSFTLGSSPNLNKSSLGLSLSQMDLNQSQNNLAPPLVLSPREKQEYVPKLMLITVAEQPKIPCELQVNVNDFSPVENWLTTTDGTLDGVYIQYEKSMMTPEGAAALRKLSEKHLVGLWGYAEKDPDNYGAFTSLVRNGNCSFVNTDLPRDFRGDIF